METKFSGYLHIYPSKLVKELQDRLPGHNITPYVIYRLMYEFKVKPLTDKNGYKFFEKKPAMDVIEDFRNIGGYVKRYEKDEEEAKLRREAKEKEEIEKKETEKKKSEENKEGPKQLSLFNETKAQ